MTREEQMMAAAERYAEEVNATFTGNDEEKHQERLVAMNDFAAGWQAADSHPHWIPVEERLPEDNTQVLAYNGKFNEVHLVDYYSGIFEDFYGPFSKGVITHWMPLPEAPRKEDKK